MNEILVLRKQIAQSKQHLDISVAFFVTFFVTSMVMLLLPGLGVVDGLLYLVGLVISGYGAANGAAVSQRYRDLILMVDGTIETLTEREANERRDAI